MQTLHGKNLLKEKPVVVGIGELLWDLLPSGKKAGGAPINFVYHATQLGAEGYAISSVGEDLLGNEIIEELNKNNIRYLIERVPYPTGTVSVELDDKGIPVYQITKAVAWDHIKPTANAIDLAEQADAICFGTLAQRSKESRETIQSILSFVSDSAYKFFDINLRQNYFSKEIVEESLYLANIVKCNNEELDVLCDFFGISPAGDKAVAWLLEKYNLKMFVLTAGASHSTIYTKDEVSTVKTPKVDIKDTVGAGDSFSGALIVSLLKGKSLKEAHQFAVETAAYVCSKSGAWPAYGKDTE